jgi:glycosidase
MEFHLSRPARERFEFDRDLLKGEGEIRQPDAQAVQELTARMNAKLGPLGRGAKPGHLFALVLIQYVLQRVMNLYRRRVMPDVFEKAEAWLAHSLREDHVQATVRHFSEHYAPLAVYRHQVPLSDYLHRPVDDRPGRQVMLERMMLVFFANINPAALTLRELYDDRELPVRDDYLKHVWMLESFFSGQPKFGPGNLSLFDLLTSPAKASPNSLLGQLEYIRTSWAEFLGQEFLRLLLLAEDLVREDERMPWRPAFGQAPDLEYLKMLASKAMFAGAYAEPERFSPDTDWMPRAVVLAKSVYVWLDQLSKEFGRPMRTLRDVPDETLDKLAAWGFSGLWLIGLWERSAASRTIKHLRGNTDAVASAYSVFDYRISADLGGEEALENLRERANQHGLCLASDLVPNHMGLDSLWVREHPDWFIQLDYPPYGAYRFEGPNLSSDPGIDIRIEDGYWSQSDAAVVFRRADKRTGHTCYIYHGNDGTSMPWNDTAQLNFLLPEVREAMIQLILRVARSFPIIRFDAAMTLTKKHFQRLWFPEPGSGGAIPSRALYGLTREEFERRMPVEFWREVVDRVAAEAPDTLLIAEAFWLLEGYFVRTLGMHRVYNSAFMNMLKLEENAKYRSVIRNVLEFDPRVLQRFVNFMNNPDEETAVAQFGKGDKYFGVCLMMVTMPGLPMFGHGQIEGLTEKYGHEYQRAYYDEKTDDELVRRHEREIFPLLRQRHLFSGAEHFLLYDVYCASGEVDENVFAFSNGYGDARALVVYHNRYAETAGWIHTSAAFSVPDGDSRRLVRKTLAEGLGLRGDAGLFYILRDQIAGLEYLRRGQDLVAHGLFVSLHAYQYQVFTSLREVRDDSDGRWSRLEQMLGGRGVPSVEREFKRIYLAPLIEAFERFCTADRLRELLGESAGKETPPNPPASRGESESPPVDGGMKGGSAGKDATKETSPIPPASRGESESPPVHGGTKGGSAGKDATKETSPNPPASRGESESLARSFAESARPFLEQALHFGGGKHGIETVVPELEHLVLAALHLHEPSHGVAFDRTRAQREARDHWVRCVPERRTPEARFWRILGGWLCVWGAGRLHDDAEAEARIARRVDDWLLNETLARVFQELGASESEAWREVDTVHALLAHGRIALTFSVPRRFAGLAAMLNDPPVQRLIGCHPHGGVVWFHRESLEELLRLLFVTTVLYATADEKTTRTERARQVVEDAAAFAQIEELSLISEYQLERFRLLLGYAARK